MRAAVLPEAGAEFELVEREVPEPAPAEVRVAVEACGICHSDAFAKEGTYPGLTYPHVPGHEIAGRIDAVLTYWHYAARLVADGHRKVIGVPEIIAGLDVGAEVPMLGYVFDAGWAQANRDAVRGFLDAARAAKRVLDEDPAAWTRLRPRIQPEDDAELAALRDGFRAGIPRAWGEDERAAARRLWTILSDLGGAELVGPGTAVAPGTFWHGDRF